MRINKFVAQATTLSRRAADAAIAEGRVLVNGLTAGPGSQVTVDDTVVLDGRRITADDKPVTVMLNKPVGYVVSRNGQGSRTIYELLPADYQHLQPVGRLDKDSSGLLLLTSDGQLAQELTHPKYQKTKVYEVTLDKPLAPLHQQMIGDHGVQLEDGRSQLGLEKLDETGRHWRITMREGRNRQIRRTFQSLGYSVARLHRTTFGPYQLETCRSGNWETVDILR